MVSLVIFIIKLEFHVFCALCKEFISGPDNAIGFTIQGMHDFLKQHEIEDVILLTLQRFIYIFLLLYV